MNMPIAPSTVKKSNIWTTKTYPGKDMLSIIKKEINQIFLEADITIRPILNHILTSGGKRLRPLLIIKSGHCFDDSKKIELIKAAVAFELIHMASLVHDDIIDASDKRHGKITVNHLWGTHCAVLVGDYLFARALGILREFNLFDCLEIAIRCIEQMSEGEIYQYHHRYNTTIGIEQYLEIIYKKTACLISGCCKVGAMISNASDYHIETIENYGLNLGYSFQITDDILDFVGEEEVLGKPVANDIKQGQVTLPLILLNSNIEHKRLIDGLFMPEINAGDISIIIEKVRKSDVIEKAKFIASLHIEKAKTSLTHIPYSDSRKTLEEIADSLINRMI